MPASTPKPKLAIRKTDFEAIVSVHFKKMGKAARFYAKLHEKPPKGVVKL